MPGRGGDFLLNKGRVSVWEDEKVPERVVGGGCPTACALKKGGRDPFYVLSVLPTPAAAALFAPLVLLP